MTKNSQQSELWKWLLFLVTCVELWGFLSNWWDFGRAGYLEQWE